MDFEIKEIGDVLLLKLWTKALDATISEVIKNKVLKVIHTGQEKMVVDLTDVEFIDSSGLGALVAIYKKMANKDHFHICGIQKPVLKVFEMAGFNHLFKLYLSQEEALFYLKNKSQAKDKSAPS